ncbi:putative MORN repeat-containing protein 3 [Hypsibius exemplaris]|uniref:MORN repeat-containing protein 3 n=1 Tax=Hypsibius exemplaris TaxID=2072580 RepID=A0A1W0WJ54_HYPEX|nr:putative MORN repeat-containing protein 3 [Hypsibius exemplaris]
MPFEPGMDSFLQSFAPVSLTQRLQLKPSPVQLRKTREKVAAWYRTATHLETRKPMQKPPPVVDAEVVIKRIDYASGNSYNGEWVNGKRHGKGQYLCESKGYLYRGEWANDTIHGQGSMFIRKPDKTWFLIYVGDYKKGQRDGWGTMRKSEQEYFEGLWIKGKRVGWGRYFSPDGTIYEGQWQADKRSGYGCTREGTGNHHVGEYQEDMKHGPGKYTFIQTGKCLRGQWKNDIPVLGEVVQLKKYKPSFPHQYPMPQQGLRDPNAVLEAGLHDTCRIIPPKPLCTLPCPYISDAEIKKKLEEAGVETEATPGSQTSKDYDEMDMRQLLTELEPEVTAISDSYMAAKTADYLLAMEYMWRCNADRTQPRPIRVKRLLAKNSQELMVLHG